MPFKDQLRTWWPYLSEDHKQKLVKPNHGVKCTYLYLGQEPQNKGGLG